MPSSGCAPRVYIPAASNWLLLSEVNLPWSGSPYTSGQTHCTPARRQPCKHARLRTRLCNHLDTTSVVSRSRSPVCLATTTSSSPFAYTMSRHYYRTERQPKSFVTMKPQSYVMSSLCLTYYCKH